jgi:mono/diheme cytochrome c family protein
MNLSIFLKVGRHCYRQLSAKSTPIISPMRFSFHPFLFQARHVISQLMSLRPRQKKRSPLILVSLLLVWSLVLGWGLAYATEPPTVSTTESSVGLGTVDPLPTRQQLGQQLYIENCGTCHLAIPPAVLPRQTWQQLLEDPRHYGVEVPPLLNPTLALVWNYLQTFSRSYTDAEVVPFQLENSRFFRALHPRVDVPRPVQLNGCVTCHPGAARYDFYNLAPEWENAP